MLKIGQTCLICYKSDQRAATIVNIISEKKIIVQGPEPFTRIFTLRKDNNWVEKGDSKIDGTYLIFSKS